MLSTLVAIGPWITSRITGIASAAERIDHDLARVGRPVVIVARVAPKTPSQTVGRNWPSTLPR